MFFVRTCLLLLSSSSVCLANSSSSDPRRTVAHLPHRLGTDQGLSWCKNGLAGALFRTVQNLLTTHIPVDSALALMAMFESQFSPLSGTMILTATQWVGLECESDLDGISRLRRLPTSAWLFPLALGDLWCRTLHQEALAPEDASRLLDSLNSRQEVAGTQQGPLGEVVSLVLNQGKQRAPFNDETIMSMIKLLPVMQRLLSFEADTPLSTRLESFSSRVCRFMDIEGLIPGLKDHTPLSCTVMDLVVATATCLPIKMEPDDPQKMHENCVQFEAHWDANAIITEFPDEVCYAPRTVLQRKEKVNEKTLRAFYWSDTNLQLSLDLNQVSPLPSYIDIAIRNSELLTYLALYRANILLYRISDNTWSSCPTKLFDKPRYLVPGWELHHMIDVQMPKLENRPEGWRHGTPFMSVSVNPRKPCEMLFVLRGTAFAFEWLLDFNYWESPMPDLEEEVHSGYTGIWQAVAPQVQYLIEQRTADYECSCQDTRLIFSGHSMGAAVGQLLATHLAVKYSQAGCPVQIDTVFFGVPRALSQEAAEIYRNNVNGRILLDLSDPLWHLPCHAGNARLGLPRCNNLHASFPGKGRDTFAENYGLIMLDVDFFSRGVRFDDSLNDVFTNTSGLDTVPKGKDPMPSVSPFMVRLLQSLLTFILPTGSFHAMPGKWELINAHLCSYSCALSVACHGLPWSSFKWWCAGMTAWGDVQK